MGTYEGLQVVAILSVDPLFYKLFMSSFTMDLKGVDRGKYNP
jgi:hypothetical protein